jgi:transposase
MDPISHSRAAQIAYQDLLRMHLDEAASEVVGKGGTTTARLWTYLRDDRPFAGGAPPAALYYF